MLVLHVHVYMFTWTISNKKHTLKCDFKWGPKNGPNHTRSFHMELLWDGGAKACLNSPGHMTKMAAVPTYDTNLLKSSSSEPNGPDH